MLAVAPVAVETAVKAVAKVAAVAATDFAVCRDVPWCVSTMFLTKLWGKIMDFVIFSQSFLLFRIILFFFFAE